MDRDIDERNRLSLDRLLEMPIATDDTAMELVNEAALPGWTVIPPSIAMPDCLSAARTVDALIGSLDAAAISRVVADGRPRLVDRSIHRREHLETIEAAFAERL